MDMEILSLFIFGLFDCIIQVVFSFIFRNDRKRIDTSIIIFEVLYLIMAVFAFMNANYRIGALEYVAACIYGFIIYSIFAGRLRKKEDSNGEDVEKSEL